MAIQNNIPKIIWIYWHSGWESAPELSRICLHNWRALNPGFDVRAIDASTVGEYLDITSLPPNYYELPLPKQANIVRLRLLDKFGGIWADATLFPTKPVSAWLRLPPKGTFAAAAEPPESDLIINNYFLASSGESLFIKKWRADYESYIRSVTFHSSLRDQKRLVRRFSFLKTKIGTLFFVTKSATKRLGAPYFAMHYIALSLVLKSLPCALDFKRSQKIEFGRLSMFPPGPNRVRSLVEGLHGAQFPAWKLSHKTYTAQQQTESHALIESLSHFVDETQSLD